MAKCKICGAPHRACGPPTTVIPIDERIERRKQGDMTLKRYNIPSGRRGDHTITVKLTEAEANRLGATEVGATSQKAAKPAANKARTASNKTAAKPATKKAPAAKPATPAVPAKSVEAASDPDASE